MVSFLFQHPDTSRCSTRETTQISTTGYNACYIGLQHLFLLDTRDHAEHYHRLRAVSPLFRLPSAKTARIADKTPEYALHLAKVMARAPLVPVLVTYSAFANQSRLRHNGGNVTELEEDYARHEEQWRHAYRLYPERLMRVDFEELLASRDSARNLLQRVFAFAGLRWDEDVLDLKRYNTRQREAGLAELPPPFEADQPPVGTKPKY